MHVHRNNKWMESLLGEIFPGLIGNHWLQNRFVLIFYATCKHVVSGHHVCGNVCNAAIDWDRDPQNLNHASGSGTMQKISKLTSVIRFSYYHQHIKPQVWHVSIVYINETRSSDVSLSLMSTVWGFIIIIWKVQQKPNSN